MATIFDPYTITDDEIAYMVHEQDVGVSAEVLRQEIDKLLKLEKNSPAMPDSLAPDFTAEKLSSDGQRSGEDLRLSSLRGDVVGLMFGSYSCPIFSGKTQRHEEIYQELKEKIQFVCVYTSEAHPADGFWPLADYEEIGFELANHTNMDDRAAAAKACSLGLGLSVTMVLDSMDDAIVSTYNGSPERLYVIDREGNITFRSSIGPFDMEDVEDWRQALLAQVKAS